MFFAGRMHQQKTYFYSGIGLAVLAAVIFLVSEKKKETSSALIKIALREVGNQLLLAGHDSTSLVLPVQKTEKSVYRLSFQRELAINPDSLVSIVAQSFLKAELPAHYRVEVKQCNDFEVAYSYQKNKQEEKNLIPCSGRILPQKCYTLEVRFLEEPATGSNTIPWLVLLLAGIAWTVAFFYKPKTTRQPEPGNKNSIPIGRFQFYPDENKLTTETTEISLSKKETELLALFTANPNKIIKREELSKKVWEDHGVFVGRSLDTYISKLRKKLQADENIKLTNIHGIGYILEWKN